MISKKVTTLEAFIVQQQKKFPTATGELSGLLRHIVLAAKIINREVNKAGLVDILGAAGTDNASGEAVMKLDVLADNELISALKISGDCCGIASEENDTFVVFDNEEAIDAKYIVCFDPLDGSSNIDVNTSIGTIFGIYRRISTSGKCTEADFLQSGRNLVAAGYVIYGSSTMLVYTTGEEVNGFTLDPSIGEFCLSHPNIKTPENGRIYSINESYQHRFSEEVNKYVAYCKVEDKATKRPYSARYIGSMVADFHRNLIKGGIFMYPAMTGYKNGKLRLLFECAPMAFIVEAAGGKATTGTKDVLDLQPTELHQRCPIFIGSPKMVEQVQFFLDNADVAPGSKTAAEQQLKSAPVMAIDG